MAVCTIFFYEHLYALTFLIKSIKLRLLEYKGNITRNTQSCDSSITFLLILLFLTSFFYIEYPIHN